MKLTQQTCPKCHKSGKLISESQIGNLWVTTYTCGHSQAELKVNVEPAPQAPATLTPAQPKSTLPEEYISIDNWVVDGGKVKDVNFVPIGNYDDFNPAFQSWNNAERCYGYQRDGIRFAEGAQLSCLFADAMGVGKTIQAIKAICRSEAISFPCLVCVPAVTIFQWVKEINLWYNPRFDSVIPITDRIHIIAGFKFYIISMDLMGKKDVRQKLSKIGFKSIIIDECQKIKDPNATRTSGIIDFIKTNDIKFKLLLSGTPIKNRVTEYGVALNLLMPGWFPNATIDASWLQPELKTNGSGKQYMVYQRLKPSRTEEFLKLISKHVIRRERSDVLTDLPPITRDFQIIEITDQNIKNSYNRSVNLFKNWIRDNKTNKSGATSSALLGWLAQIRSITGTAKCKAAVEWALDFLESTDEQLAIGIHHKAVREILFNVLHANGVKVIELSGEDNTYEKNRKVNAFQRGEVRVLVMNEIAGGLGINLQNCAQAVVLERMWNSADEEQFECRFHRNGQIKAVTITYMIAKGTIDEFFHEMVTNKKQILISTGLGRSEDATMDLNFLNELAEKVSNSNI